MSQNTHNVRTRREQLSTYPESVCVGRYSDGSWQLRRDGDHLDGDRLIEGPVLYVRCDIAHQSQTEARGAEEQRRKDGELSRAKLFCQNEQEASDRTPERPDVVQWQKDRNEFFLSSTLEVVTEYAAWRDRKDAEGQAPVAWHYYDEEDGDGRGGWRYSSSKLSSRYEDVHPLYDRPANVDALEARIAELVEAEQLARADAEASKARVKVLEGALRNVCSAIEQADPKVLCCTLWMTTPVPETVVDYIRAALAREGGV
ncbi:hypothetical protein Gbfr_022_045 [Gluconobacter frateurii M-2]|nr:hypothetical protein Gbfr_022_045 [Gluconobacter frateurii M-2]